MAVAIVAAVSGHGSVAGAHDAIDARPRAVDPSEAAYTYGVGAFRPEYTPPAPGTYALPPIATISDHPLLDDKGTPTRLFDVVGGRIAVIAFVYTTCTEAAGCPVSFAVLHGLDRALAADRALARRVRLITISFDPERDTPTRMASRFHASIDVVACPGFPPTGVLRVRPSVPCQTTNFFSVANSYHWPLLSG